MHLHFTDEHIAAACITPQHTQHQAQLDMLSAASVAQHGKTLAQYVESDISGAFGKMMGYALLDVDEYGATVFSAATDGVG
jgi:hypothetical protein